jgi:hypothetical protein
MTGFEGAGDGDVVVGIGVGGVGMQGEEQPAHHQGERIESERNPHGGAA